MRFILYLSDNYSLRICCVPGVQGIGDIGQQGQIGGPPLVEKADPTKKDLTRISVELQL